MLICNEIVVNYFYWLNVLFLYRVYEEFDIEKIYQFVEFIYNMGYVLKGILNKVYFKVLQVVLE